MGRKLSNRKWTSSNGLRIDEGVQALKLVKLNLQKPKAQNFMKRVVKPSFNQHEVNLYAQTYNSRAYKQATYIAVFSCNTSKYNAGRVNTECDRECTCHPVTKHKGRLLAD